MRSFSARKLFGSAALLSLFSAGCAIDAGEAPKAISLGSAPRNVILVIGDGMGPQQIALSEIYWQRTGDKNAQPLHNFLSEATNGVHIPLPERSLVNDSACAASQLAGGCRCEPRQIGIDIEGVPCHSVLRVAKQAGLRVGLVSDTRITHATPAAFYGQVSDREQEFKIAEQLVEAGVDVALSGGADFFRPPAAGMNTAGNGGAASCERPDWGKRSDQINLLKLAQARGSQVVCSSAELKRARNLPVLGLFASGHMANAFREGEGSEPTLAEMTERALELLENQAGFFLMVESGQIDTAGHYNDAGWVLAEMLRLSSVLRVVERYREHHPETLVVLTADHETGGMGFSYHRAEGAGVGTESPAQHIDFVSNASLDMLRKQGVSISEIIARQIDKTSIATIDLKVTHRALQGALRDAMGVTIDEGELATLIARSSAGNSSKGEATVGDAYAQSFYPYDNHLLAASIGRRISAARGVVWATGTHTSTPVNVLALGPGADRFQGWLSAKDVGQRLIGIVEAREASDT